MTPIILKHEMAWRIRATFEGKLPPNQYITPDVRHNDPGWGSELFNRPIEMLEFFLPTGHKIVMAGMEQYNFFIEAMQSPGQCGGAEIQAFWLCGRLSGRDIVETWRIGDGKILRDRRSFGQEWGGGPTRGWKQGLVGNKVISMMAQG